MTTDEALQIYDSLSQTIFSKNNRKRIDQDGAFKATTLETKVQEIVSQKGLGEHMIDPSNSTKGRVFVCTKPAHNIAHVRRFRSYPVRDLASSNCKIWEATRATTAAPTFFKRITIEGEEFVDGALGSNNPATEVLNEAVDVFDIDRPVRCLVSIGTGYPGTIGVAKPVAFQKILATNLVPVLKRIATDCEQEANRLSIRFRALEKFYFRFNVAHGAEGILLEEWNKAGLLKAHTKAYMAEVSVQKAINDVVDILCRPRMVQLTLGSVC
jgi:predicted acylesterase/phospholipase RssA